MRGRGLTGVCGRARSAAALVGAVVAAALGAAAAQATTSGKLLGGLDLAAYCQTFGYTTATLSSAQKWVCVHKNGSHTAIDLQAACEAQYRQRPILVEQVTPGNAETWECFQAGAGAVPVLAQSVAAGTVSGSVTIEKPGSSTFAPLSASAVIPVGSTVDATGGRVQLTSASRVHGRTYTGQFYGGAFRVTEGTDGLTVLTLTGGVACTTGAVRASAHAPLRKRSLWGDAHGNFKTVGRYAAATVLGTHWLTADRCTGTLIRVATGEVRVEDLVRHHRFVLRAPHRYLARP